MKRLFMIDLIERIEDEFGADIRTLFMRWNTQGMSGPDIAETCGVSHSSIRKWRYIFKIPHKKIVRACVGADHDKSAINLARRQGYYDVVSYAADKVALGWTRAQIAQGLGCDPDTVTRHCRLKIKYPGTEKQRQSRLANIAKVNNARRESAEQRYIENKKRGNNYARKDK